MKLNIKPTKKGFTLVELLVVMAIIAVLASISTPIVFSKLKDADRTKALSNAKEIGKMILDFENENNIRPGEDITTRTGSSEVPGSAASTSNDAFRQLFQALSYVRSEQNFYAKSKISVEPDDDIGDSSNNFAQAIAKGECGFSYVDVPDSKTGAPLAAAPFSDGSGTFDFEAYNGKAVVLKTDFSVVTPDINEDDNKVTIKASGSDVDMFSSSNPTLKNKTVNILYPDPQ